MLLNVHNNWENFGKAYVCMYCRRWKIGRTKSLANLSINLCGGKKFGGFIQNCKYVWILDWFVQLANKVWRKQHNSPNFSPSNFSSFTVVKSLCYLLLMHSCTCVLMHVFICIGDLVKELKSADVENSTTAIEKADAFLQSSKTTGFDRTLVNTSSEPCGSTECPVRFIKEL